MSDVGKLPGRPIGAKDEDLEKVRIVTTRPGYTTGEIWAVPSVRADRWEEQGIARRLKPKAETKTEEEDTRTEEVGGKGGRKK